MTDDRHLQTRTVRAALETDEQHGAVVPPIHLTSTFAFAGFGQKRKYDYSRSGNPTRDALAGALAELEGGVGAVVTASGMAAVALVAHLFGPEQLVVIPHDCYGGTYRLFNALARKGAVQVQFLDFGDAAALEAVLARRPAMIWIETPSNPLLRIVDLATTARAARAAGALVVADNTFLSPVWQRPILSYEPARFRLGMNAVVAVEKTGGDDGPVVPRCGTDALGYATGTIVRIADDLADRSRERRG